MQTHLVCIASGAENGQHCVQILQFPVGQFHIEFSSQTHLFPSDEGIELVGHEQP